MTTGEPRKPDLVRHEVLGRRTAPGVVPVGDFTYSIIEVATEKPAGEKSSRDKRGDRRVRTHLREATVREARGRALVECRIRDVSRTGARLQLDRERPLPRSFLLREGSSHQSFWATLVWQVGRDAGVKLKPAPDQRV